MIKNSLSYAQEIIKLHIPPAERGEALHLHSILLDAGATPLQALVVLYKHTAGRPARAGIHRGLQEYFDAEVKQLCD